MAKKLRYTVEIVTERKTKDFKIRIYDTRFDAEYLFGGYDSEYSAKRGYVNICRTLLKGENIQKLW